MGSLVPNRLSIKSSEESVENGYIDFTIIAIVFNKLRLKITEHIYWRSHGLINTWIWTML